MATAAPTASDPSAVVLLIVLAAAAVTDILTAKVYNALTYPAMVLGVGLAAASGRPALEASLLGLALGAGLWVTAHWFGGLGKGDAKLIGAVGALSGPAFTLQTAVYGVVVAAALGIMLVVAHGETAATLRRLAAAAGLAKPGPAVPPKLLPGGFCICLGAAWAWLEHLNRTTLWDWAVGRMFPNL